jgi:hypothetical protein
MATEGTLESYIDRRVAIWETITGINHAFKEPPAALQDAQLPAVVIDVTGPAVRQRYTHDTLIGVQRLVETVYLRRAGAHLSDNPIGTTGWALIDAVDAAFFLLDRNNSGSTPQASVQEVTPPVVNGFEILEYGGTADGLPAQYVAIRFVTDVRYQRVFGP